MVKVGVVNYIFMTNFIKNFLKVSSSSTSWFLGNQVSRKFGKIITSALVTTTILTTGGVFLFQKLNQNNITADAKSITTGLKNPKTIWKSDFNSQNWKVATNSSSNVTWNKQSDGYYFGDKNTNTFQNGTNQVSGFLESPSIIIPTDSSYYLSVSHKFAVEQSTAYDKLLIQVVGENGQTKTFDLRKDGLVPSQSFTVPTDYETNNLDISEFAGGQFTIKFNFDSVDGIANNYYGWLLKSANIVSVGGFPLPNTETIWNQSGKNWSFSGISTSPKKWNYYWGNGYISNCSNPAEYCVQGGTPTLRYGNQFPSNPNFDSGRDYPEGNGGTATTIDSISLPKSTSINLSMDYQLDVEDNQDKDIARLDVLTLDDRNMVLATTTVWTKVLTPNGLGFVNTNVDLTKFAGQKIGFQFFFDSVDNIENSGRGWEIKNMEIKATSKPNPVNQIWPINNNYGWNKINSISNVANLWNVTNDGIMYGNGTNFIADGFKANGGTMTSAIIDVPVLQDNEYLSLNLDYLLDVEDYPYYDKAKILVNYTPEIKCDNIQSANCSSANNKAVIWEKGVGSTTKDFKNLSVTLPKYSGQKIQLEFYFDTVDYIGNEGQGWKIKNPTLTKKAYVYSI